jgi:hypothetical protein
MTILTIIIKVLSYFFYLFEYLAYYFKGNKIYRISFSAFFVGIGVIIPYHSYYLIVMLLLVLESFNLLQDKGLITYLNRESQHIQSGVAITYITALVLQTGLSHVYPFADSSFLWGCFLVCGYLSLLFEVNYHGGVRLSLRKARLLSLKSIKDLINVLMIR